MNDDFSKHPKSLAEVKAERSQNGAEWSPRDALIDLLRDIDSGKVDVREVIISYNFKKGADIYYTFSAATHSSLHGQVGMLEIVKHKIMER